MMVQFAMLVSSAGRGIQTTLVRSSCNSVSSVIFNKSASMSLILIAIFMIAVSPAALGYTQGGAYKALYASILGPFFLTILLMFVSGLTLQERPGAKKRYEKGINWPAYERWLHRTSILIPFPPQIYAKLPVILKRTVFLEFPIYVFDTAKHADKHPSESQAGAEEGRAEHRNSDGEPLRNGGA